MTFVISSEAVSALARGDAERLLRFVADAESFGGDHPFEGEFLTQLGGLISADLITYIEFPDWSPNAEPIGFDRPGDERFDDVIDMCLRHVSHEVRARLASAQPIESSAPPSRLPQREGLEFAGGPLSPWVLRSFTRGWVG